MNNQLIFVLPATRPIITLSTMANAMEYVQIADTTSILSISSARHARYLAFSVLCQLQIALYARLLHLSADPDAKPVAHPARPV